MSSTNSFLVPTNPKLLPQAQHLVHSTGTNGVTTWLDLLRDFLRLFGPAGKEFADGVYHDPVPPSSTDTFPQPVRRSPKPTRPASPNRLSHIPVSIHRQTNLDHDLTMELPEENAAGGGAPVPPIPASAPTHPSRATTTPLPTNPIHPVGLLKYEQDTSGVLTPQGMTAFRQAYVAYESNLLNLNNLRAACFTFVLSNMSQSSIDALKLNDHFAHASEHHDLVELRHAIEDSHKSTSLMIAIDVFANVTKAKQGSGSLTDFFTRVAVLVRALASAFASPTNPNVISIQALHLAIIFAGINTNHFQAYLDKLSLDPTLKHMDDLTVPSVTSALILFDNNRQTRETNAKATNHPSSDMSLKQAQKIINEHKNNKQQQQPQAGNALVNASTNATNNNTTTNKPPSEWTPTHPHSRPRRSTPGPGNIRRPHCTHCAKNNWIFNNHGLSKDDPCTDIRPTATDQQSTAAAQQPNAVTQQSLVTQFAAMMHHLQGHTPADQADEIAELQSFMNSPIFDASSLRAFGTAPGAAVPDADIDEEARRACGGGPAPKN